MRPLLPSLLSLSLVAGSSLLGIGCTEETDRQSQIDSLRVVAVRTDLPFAPPGSRPELEMLLHDGSPTAILPDGTPRHVQVLWLGTCVNPTGDLYYNCFPVLHETMRAVSDAELAAEQVPAGTPDGVLGFGTRFTPAIPTDAITRRTQAPGIVYPYGVLFLFYAACAGELRHVPDANPTTDYPVGCFRPGTNEALGQDDFEFGQYSIYVYDGLLNTNPRVSSLAFSAPASGASCTDASACGDREACGSKGVCIPVVSACAAKKAEDCPGYTLNPIVDRASAEPAASAHIAQNLAPTETLWVSYYSTAGLFDKDTRLVSDPSAGWSDGYEGIWRPALGGRREVSLFAVVRDNRGGVNWVSQDVEVE